MVTQTQIPGWLTGEYPFSPRRHRLADGTSMSFLDEGPRSPSAVVMVHGNPTWSYYYRHLVRALAPGVRCVAPDHVGMGLSDKPADRAYTLAQRITDLEHLIASLGLEQIDLVVHDWGGAIGLGFAGRHPGKVRRLLILNTAAFPDSRIPARIALCRVPLLGPLIVRGGNGFAWPATWMAMSRRALGAARSDTAAALALAADAEARLAAALAQLASVSESRAALAAELQRARAAAPLAGIRYQAADACARRWAKVA